MSDILDERAKTHGSFLSVARVAQELKRVIYGGYNYQDLSDQQSEALDMIASKIGRILAGNPNEVDHWRDIAGYATLIERELTPPAGLETKPDR